MNFSVFSSPVGCVNLSFTSECDFSEWDPGVPVLDDYVPPVGDVVAAIRTRPTAKSPGADLLVVVGDVTVVTAVGLGAPTVRTVCDNTFRGTAVPSELCGGDYRGSRFISPTALFAFSGSDRFALGPARPGDPFRGQLCSLDSDDTSACFLFVDL